MPEKVKIKRLPAVYIARDGKRLDVTGCLVKCKNKGKAELCLNTYREVIDCESKYSYSGTLDWKCEGCTLTVPFKVKKRIIECDGEKASFLIKLDTQLKKDIMQVVPEQSSTFLSNKVLYVITRENEVIEATVTKEDHNSVKLKPSMASTSVIKGCPIYDAQLKMIGLVKSKICQKTWSVSWVSLQHDSASIMPEVLKMGRLPAVNIRRDYKILDVAGCLVKRKYKGKDQLCLKTYKDIIDCKSKASYTGILNWQSEDCALAWNIDLKVEKRIIEKDGDLACFLIKLEKELKREIMQVLPEESSTSLSNRVLYIITRQNEVFEAIVTGKDRNSIMFKPSMASTSVIRGCPIYDAHMKMIGLVKSKISHYTWNVSWDTLQNGNLEFAEHSSLQENEPVREVHGENRRRGSNDLHHRAAAVCRDRQDERPADCIPYDTFERDESEKALPYGLLDEDPITCIYETFDDAEEDGHKFSSDLEDECSSTCNSDPINEENEYGYEMSNDLQGDCQAIYLYQNANVRVEDGYTMSDDSQDECPADCNFQNNKAVDLQDVGCLADCIYENVKAADAQGESPVTCNHRSINEGHEREQATSFDKIETTAVMTDSGRADNCIAGDPEDGHEEEYAFAYVLQDHFPTAYICVNAKEEGDDIHAMAYGVQGKIPASYNPEEITEEDLEEKLQEVLTEVNCEQGVCEQHEETDELEEKTQTILVDADLGEGGHEYHDKAHDLPRAREGYGNDVDLLGVDESKNEEEHDGMQEDSKYKRRASQHLRSQNTASTQCPSLHLGYSNSCSNLRKRFKYDASGLQPCKLMRQRRDNQCCVSGQRCQSCLQPMPCSYVASSGNQSIYSTKQPFGCGSCNLVVAVDNGNPVEARKQASRKRKRRKKRRRKHQKSGRNRKKTKYTSQQRRKSNHADSVQTLQPVSTRPEQASLQMRESCWNTFNRELRIEDMDYNIVQDLANRLDLKDWQRLARALQVPESKIRDISFTGNFPAVNFLWHLLTLIPGVTLSDFRQKVMEIERYDVVEFIDSSLQEFEPERLSKIPKDKQMDLMKRLGEKAAAITKDWKNVAALYNLKRDEIDCIASQAPNCTQKGPMECLIDYFQTSMPWISVADLGLALEALGFASASRHLYNSYMKAA